MAREECMAAALPQTAATILQEPRTHAVQTSPKAKPSPACRPQHSRLSVASAVRRQPVQQTRSLAHVSPLGAMDSQWRRGLAEDTKSVAHEQLCSKLAASRTSLSTLHPIASTPKVGRLRAATSMPTIDPHRPRLSLLRRDDHGSVRLDETTRLKLAEAEQRANAYIATRRLDAAMPFNEQAATGSAQSLVSGWNAEELRSIWQIPTRAKLFVPDLAALPSEPSLAPLSHADAIDSLQKCRVCDGLATEELEQLLEIGHRKILPRYAVVMREAATGSHFFIVMNGRLQISASRIESQHQGNSLQESNEHLQTAPTDGTIEPGDTFGEVSALTAVVRDRNVVTLDPTELLILSLDHRQGLPPALAQKLRNSLMASYVSAALHHVNFFSALPNLTKRQLSTLFELRFLPKGTTVFRQGDLGTEMYILLFGRLQVWRTKKRNQPKTMLAEYTGLSTYPW